MQETVYVTGHRSPDTDSICSALAYASLKNRLGHIKAIPARLGELNPESRFVLNYFHLEPPKYLDTLQPHVADLAYDPAFGISPSTTLYRANDIMQDNNQNTLAVVNANQELIGVISASNITKTYADVWDDNILSRSETPLSNIVDVISAEILFKPEKPRKSTGSIDVYAMEQLDNQLIHENDIALLGDRVKAQKAAIEAGVAILILTNGTKLNDELLPLAKENRVTVLSTNLTTFMTSRLLPQAVPVSYIMTRENIIAFHLDDTIDEVREKMGNTRYRSYPVLDANNHVVGSASRYHLINTERKKVILVDHNEATQSVPDIDRADILEIIDHHRVANVSTNSPIYYRAEPVGCTCTIIAQIYFEQGIRPSREEAGLMMSAIISDTLLFRSPTTTELDKKMVKRLSTLCGIDPEEYGMKMFEAGTNLSGKGTTDILTDDAKFFNIEGLRTKIAQVMTMNIDSLHAMREKLLTRMDELSKEQGYDLYILVVTDIFKESSTILVHGPYAEEIAREYGQTLDHNEFTAEGVMSRKKQVVPVVTAAVAKAMEVGKH